jgi:hypothetical protein
MSVTGVVAEELLATIDRLELIVVAKDNQLKKIPLCESHQQINSFGRCLECDNKRLRERIKRALPYIDNAGIRQLLQAEIVE